MFTLSNWNIGQSATLSAADADAVNGTTTFEVVSPGLPSVQVVANEADNDTLALVISPFRSRLEKEAPPPSK